MEVLASYEGGTLKSPVSVMSVAARATAMIIAVGALVAIGSRVPAVELNGATRACGVAAAGVVMASALALYNRKCSPRNARLYRSVAICAAIMAILAFLVRNDCRAGYYTGCGVNVYMYTGLLLSLIVIVASLYFAYWGKHGAWLVAAAAMYVGDYFLSFQLLMPVFGRVIICALAVIAAAWGVYRLSLPYLLLLRVTTNRRIMPTAQPAPRVRAGALG